MPEKVAVMGFPEVGLCSWGELFQVDCCASPSAKCRHGWPWAREKQARCSHQEEFSMKAAGAQGTIVTGRNLAMKGVKMCEHCQSKAVPEKTVAFFSYRCQRQLFCFASFRYLFFFKKGKTLSRISSQYLFYQSQ